MELAAGGRCGSKYHDDSLNLVDYDEVLGTPDLESI
jgi:hypothetical protein